jgi:hypothetical protein
MPLKLTVFPSASSTMQNGPEAQVTAWYSLGELSEGSGFDHDEPS